MYRPFSLLMLVLAAAPVDAQDIAARFPVGSITTREQADVALAATRQEEARIDQEYAARDAECYRKFMVNDCRDKVRREKELARREVKRVELEAGNTRRLLDQQDAEQRRNAQQQQHEARDRERPRSADGGGGNAVEGSAAAPAPRQPATGKTAARPSTPLSAEEVARNRAEHDAKQKAHAERLAREQAEAGTRAGNAAVYQQKQADAAQRAADSEQRRKEREARRAKRNEDLKQKEAEREQLRQRAADAAAGSVPAR